MSGTESESDRAAVTVLQAAAGEDPGELRPAAAAGQSSAPSEGAAGRNVSRPARKRAGLRQSGQRQDALAVSPGPRTYSERTARSLQHVRASGPGSAARQERSAAEPSHQE